LISLYLLLSDLRLLESLPQRIGVITIELELSLKKLKGVIITHENDNILVYKKKKHISLKLSLNA